MQRYGLFLSILCAPQLWLINGCSIPDDAKAAAAMEPQRESSDGQQPSAEILEVTPSGEAQSYRFSVKLKSPDTGCPQYADWWEVLSPEGTLLYRRILGHSHVDEQPFTRSGGPVAIQAQAQVFIRAHMNNTGYADTLFEGSVESGFKRSTESPEFPKTLEMQAPQPSGCAY